LSNSFYSIINIENKIQFISIYINDIISNKIENFQKLNYYEKIKIITKILNKRQVKFNKIIYPYVPLNSILLKDDKKILIEG
jgi:hypothetical protein